MVGLPACTKLSTHLQPATRNSSSKYPQISLRLSIHQKQWKQYESASAPTPTVTQFLPSRPISMLEAPLHPRRYQLCLSAISLTASKLLMPPTTVRLSNSYFLHSPKAILWPPISCAILTTATSVANNRKSSISIHTRNMYGRQSTLATADLAAQSNMRKLSKCSKTSPE
jgi:hypothetical protein